MNLCQHVIYSVGPFSLICLSPFCSNSVPMFYRKRLGSKLIEWNIIKEDMLVVDDDANNSVKLSSRYLLQMQYAHSNVWVILCVISPPIWTDEYFNVIPLQGGNKLKPQPFRLNWAWISLETQYYLVNEDVKFLEVTLRRRGFLGETSFVSKFTQESRIRLSQGLWLFADGHMLKTKSDSFIYS